MENLAKQPAVSFVALGECQQVAALAEGVLYSCLRTGFRYAHHTDKSVERGCSPYFICLDSLKSAIAL